MFATLVPQVAVQLLFAALCAMAATAGTIKPRVSCGGTESTMRVVPPVASFIVTLVYVEDVLVTTRPYKSADKPVPAAVTIVVSELELAMVVCCDPSASRFGLVITFWPFLPKQRLCLVEF